MLKTILVPLDGSEFAERALIYASALSTQTDAHLLLVRAAMSHTAVGANPRERQQGAIHEAEQYLEQVAARLRLRNFACETLVPYGRAATCITDESRLRHVDMVVMATHGRSGPGRWILGSVAESVVGSSGVPVLVQRAWQPRFDEAFLAGTPKLIVPLDEPGFGEAALEPAARLATELGGSLVLVQVVDDPSTIHTALEYLQAVQTRLAQSHPGLVVETDARVGEPAHEIEQASAHHAAALVVMATHGRAGAQRAMLGSVAGKLLQHGHVPVVLMRPTPTEDDAPMKSVLQPVPAG